MGKPYVSEIAQLVTTYKWASHYDNSKLRQAIATAGALPLVAIGSGGSLTAAHFITSLHRRYTGKIAYTATPLEVISEQIDRRTSMWLLSAGGGNVDIISAFNALVRREHAQVGVICGRPESPLVAKANQHDYVDLFDFSMPVGKDGFLATNSLLAFCVLIARAYAEEYKEIDGNLDNFVPEPISVGLDSEVLSKWREAVDPLWARETTVVLHGIASRTGAIDLESKFTEAAIGNLQIADYRNFAHGRHHWLAKRGKSSAILAFTTPEDRDLADKTLALIPDDIPVARIDLVGNHQSTSLASLVAAIHITGWAGISRGIDPGRPGVPEFGRKLYHLPFPKTKKDLTSISVEDTVAIERKTGVSIKRLLERGDLPQWRSALATFKKNLKATKFFAVVFDYDGTLVDTRVRFFPPIREIVGELIRMIEAGLIIGIATGRGASVRRDLQSCLPRNLWGRVIVGYYNGADISFLDDDSRPDGEHESEEVLIQISSALRCHPELREIAIQEDRRWQITLKSCQAIPENRLWDISNEVVQLHGLSNINIVRSSHSIDILAPSVTKRSVIHYINETRGHDDVAGILKVGDRGCWPGNDFELLREPYSLSVDELSADPSTCWNLAPRGQRGVQATLNYCRALKGITGGGANFDLSAKDRKL
jgi:hydroxymethylpyrimidine pyrophosphatase-like HAD family hydrolase